MTLNVLTRYHSPLLGKCERLGILEIMAWAPKGRFQIVKPKATKTRKAKGHAESNAQHGERRIHQRQIPDHQNTSPTTKSQGLQAKRNLSVYCPGCLQRGGPVGASVDDEAAKTVKVTPWQ